MKLDLTVIKNESILKFEKAISKVGQNFEEMLSLALDTAIHEIDADKRADISVALNDMFRDEFIGYRTNFVRCLNKASDLVENGLGS